MMYKNIKINWEKVAFLIAEKFAQEVARNDKECADIVSDTIKNAVRECVEIEFDIKD